MSSQKIIKVLVSAYSCVSESGVQQIGGEAELGIQLVKQLSRFFDVSVLTHSYNQKAVESFLEKEPLKSVKFFYFKLPIFFGFLENFHKGGIQIYSYLWQIQAYFFARKLHKEIQFDAFHHITYANDWMTSFIGALLPVPYLRGPGGGAHKIPKAFLANYSLKEKFLEKLRTVGQWIFRHDPFFIISQNKAKAILVCNKESFNALNKRWQKKAFLFPVNGVSEKDFSVPPQKKDDAFTIITAGKLLKLKNFDLAVRAFKIFHDSFNNSRLVIVGDGPEFLHLQSLAEKLGISGSIYFKKWMPRKQLLSEIASSGVFVFPSLRDGGGAVVVEAMAQGKPVVCFDISGPGIHIKEEWGIKIKPENPRQAVEDMALALEKLYKDGNLRNNLGEQARKRAEGFYLWDVLGDRLKEMYQAVIFKS